MYKAKRKEAAISVFFCKKNVKSFCSDKLSHKWQSQTKIKSSFGNKIFIEILT